MTTDELIRILRETAENIAEWSAEEFETDGKLMLEASDQLEEKDKIIKQYQKADCFLAAHGWEWDEGGCWYDD